jgi:hypothetical protein
MISIATLVTGILLLAFAFLYPKVSPIILTTMTSGKDQQQKQQQQHNANSRFTLFDPSILKLHHRLETMKMVAIASISSSMLVITLILLMPSLLLYYRQGRRSNGSGDSQTLDPRRDQENGVSRKNSSSNNKNKNGSVSSKRSMTGDAAGSDGGECSGCGHNDVFRLTQEISRIQPQD